MMALKRKASFEGVSTPKRLQKDNTQDNIGQFNLQITADKATRLLTIIPDLDMINEDLPSDADDAEYSAPGTPSVMSHDMNNTPATPMSTTSSRYPSELKTIRCPFEGCDKAFNRPARLKDHIRSHNNERLFRCDFEGCDKSFLRPTHLSHHVKSAHSDVRDYACDRPGCTKSFVNGSRLRRHLAAHDGRDQHRCTEYPPCNETFRKHSTLQKHVLSVHKKQKPFPCLKLDPATGEKCKMAFDTAGNLRTHESRVHIEKRFTCMECSENQQEQSSDMNQTDKDASQDCSFPTYTSLQEHIRTVHPPKCPQCPMVCSTSRELRRHIEVAHGDVSLEDRKVFPCHYGGCDRSFTRQGNLTVHIRTVHEGEKRFVCGETDLSKSKKVTNWDGIGCGHRYGSKLALEDHIRTQHMGLKNAKATRRERLGLKEKSQPQQTSVSTLAALTGQGYAEESGRQIKCLYTTCPNRFHRDYDLWLHMTTKHGCSEDSVENMFLQRALLADETGTGGNPLGMYGLGFDHDSQYNHQSYMGGDNSSDVAFGSQSNDSSSYLPAQQGLNSDYLMQDDISAHTSGNGNIDSMIPNYDEMALIDPVIAYNLQMEQ
ncbi:uncharacterized protein N7529_008515 [Penicillium soppii]|jgi:general transcription factor IIIA|uniref:uncharacterized protein n=1 Tax=Penicillium soppii TaxID=69789 RepID=UPI0025471AD8|nr:uncharacterized protein N7529_008515 [Penicillium soppii]KAJ5861205.1 hypothetical protein N7529_008515 [Penicillium soppii]